MTPLKKQKFSRKGAKTPRKTKKIMLENAHKIQKDSLKSLRLCGFARGKHFFQ